MLVSYLTYSTTLKIEAICSSETSPDFYQTTRCYITQYGTVHSQMVVAHGHNVLDTPFVSFKLQPTAINYTTHDIIIIIIQAINTNTDIISGLLQDQYTGLIYSFVLRQTFKTRHRVLALIHLRPLESSSIDPCPLFLCVEQLKCLVQNGSSSKSCENECLFHHRIYGTTSDVSV
jgi:hypothetical protein